MAHVIESVADLTARSDRDELEITLASLSAKLLSATQLIFWRLASCAGELRLQERVRLTERRVAVADSNFHADDLPTLDSRAQLRACYDGRTPLNLGRDASGQHGHVFPVTSARGVVGLLEIYHDGRRSAPPPLWPAQHLSQSSENPRL